MSLVDKIKDYFSVSALQQGLALPSAAVAITLASRPNNSLLDYVAVGGCAFSLFFNEALTVRKYALMNRFEEAIEKFGYDPRLARPFMNSYCGRNVVKWVLKKEHLSWEYQSLSK